MNDKPNGSCFYAAILLVVQLLLTLQAVAQVQYGELTGRIQDPSGAVIVGATVDVTHLGTGHTFTVTANAAGVYRAPQLPIGPYSLEATFAGFKTARQTGVVLHAGVIARVDFRLEVGEVTEVVVVEYGGALVNIEDSRPYTTVRGREIEDLPLDGRNPYNLIQLASGAVNVAGVSFEKGERTSLNGLRPNFNGFTLNGSSNKGLSGGTVTIPNPDIVAEFQIIELNVSAQYGNSAGSITNLVTKSGSNDFHGSVFWFFRDESFDANSFFRNRAGEEKPPLSFDQFGGHAAGPILKDKLFFTASVQVENFETFSPPSPILVESPEWRQAVIAAQSGNPSSVAGFLYQNFPFSEPGTPVFTVEEFVASGFSIFGATTFAEYLCDSNLSFLADILIGGPNDPNAPLALAQDFANLFGVTAQDQADMSALGCTTILPLQPGLIPRDTPLLVEGVATARIGESGDLFEGYEWSTRLDWVGENDRIFGELFWQKRTDTGFTDPRGVDFPGEKFTPNFQLSWLHTFSPSVLNDLRVGFARSRDDLLSSVPGLPLVEFFGVGELSISSDATSESFVENILTYADTVSISAGSHNIKTGVELRQNREISLIDAGVPFYGFFDHLFFAVDAPFVGSGGVDPGFVSGEAPRLATNVRDWRNREFGASSPDAEPGHPLRPLYTS
jgi:hypothetical protein